MKPRKPKTRYTDRLSAYKARYNAPKQEEVELAKNDSSLPKVKPREIKKVEKPPILDFQNSLENARKERQVIFAEVRARLKDQNPAEREEIFKEKLGTIQKLKLLNIEIDLLKKAVAKDRPLTDIEIDEVLNTQKLPEKTEDIPWLKKLSKSTEFGSASVSDLIKIQNEFVNEKLDVWNDTGWMFEGFIELRKKIDKEITEQKTTPSTTGDNEKLKHTIEMTKQYSMEQKAVAERKNALKNLRAGKSVEIKEDDNEQKLQILLSLKNDANNKLAIATQKLKELNQKGKTDSAFLKKYKEQLENLKTATTELKNLENNKEINKETFAKICKLLDASPKNYLPDEKKLSENKLQDKTLSEIKKNLEKQGNFAGYSSEALTRFHKVFSETYKPFMEDLLEVLRSEEAKESSKEKESLLGSEALAKIVSAIFFDNDPILSQKYTNDVRLQCFADVQNYLIFYRQLEQELIEAMMYRIQLAGEKQDLTFDDPIGDMQEKLGNKLTETSRKTSPEQLSEFRQYIINYAKKTGKNHLITHVNNLPIFATPTNWREKTYSQSSPGINQAEEKLRADPTIWLALNTLPSKNISSPQLGFFENIDEKGVPNWMKDFDQKLKAARENFNKIKDDLPEDHFMRMDIEKELNKLEKKRTHALESIKLTLLQNLDAESKKLVAPEDKTAPINFEEVKVLFANLKKAEKFLENNSHDDIPKTNVINIIEQAFSKIAMEKTPDRFLITRYADILSYAFLGGNDNKDLFKKTSIAVDDQLYKLVLDAREQPKEKVGNFIQQQFSRIQSTHNQAYYDNAPTYIINKFINAPLIQAKFEKVDSILKDPKVNKPKIPIELKTNLASLKTTSMRTKFFGDKERIEFEKRLFSLEHYTERLTDPSKKDPKDEIWKENPIKIVESINLLLQQMDNEITATEKARESASSIWNRDFLATSENWIKSLQTKKLQFTAKKTNLITGLQTGLLADIEKGSFTKISEEMDFLNKLLTSDTEKNRFKEAYMAKISDYIIKAKSVTLDQLEVLIKLARTEQIQTLIPKVVAETFKKSINSTEMKRLASIVKEFPSYKDAFDQTCVREVLQKNSPADFSDLNSIFSDLRDININPTKYAEFKEAVKTILNKESIFENDQPQLDKLRDITGFLNAFGDPSIRDDYLTKFSQEINKYCSNLTSIDITYLREVNDVLADMNRREISIQILENLTKDQTKIENTINFEGITSLEDLKEVRNFIEANSTLKPLDSLSDLVAGAKKPVPSEALKNFDVHAAALLTASCQKRSDQVDIEYMTLALDYLDKTMQKTAEVSKIVTFIFDESKNNKWELGVAELIEKYGNAKEVHAYRNKRIQEILATADKDKALEKFEDFSYSLSQRGNQLPIPDEEKQALNTMVASCVNQPWSELHEKIVKAFGTKEQLQNLHYNHMREVLFQQSGNELYLRQQLALQNKEKAQYQDFLGETNFNKLKAEVTQFVEKEYQGQINSAFTLNELKNLEGSSNKAYQDAKEALADKINKMGGKTFAEFYRLFDSSVQEIINSKTDLLTSQRDLKTANKGIFHTLRFNLDRAVEWSKHLEESLLRTEEQKTITLEARIADRDARLKQLRDDWERMVSRVVGVSEGLERNVEAQDRLRTFLNSGIIPDKSEMENNNDYKLLSEVEREILANYGMQLRGIENAKILAPHEYSFENNPLTFLTHFKLTQIEICQDYMNELMNNQFRNNTDNKIFTLEEKIIQLEKLQTSGILDVPSRDLIKDTVEFKQAMNLSTKVKTDLDNNLVSLLKGYSPETKVALEENIKRIDDLINRNLISEENKAALKIIQANNLLASAIQSINSLIVESDPSKLLTFLKENKNVIIPALKTADQKNKEFFTENCINYLMNAAELANLPPSRKNDKIANYINLSKEFINVLSNCPQEKFIPKDTARVDLLWKHCAEALKIKSDGILNLDNIKQYNNLIKLVSAEKLKHSSEKDLLDFKNILRQYANDLTEKHGLYDSPNTSTMLKIVGDTEQSIRKIKIAAEISALNNTLSASIQTLVKNYLANLGLKDNDITTILAATKDLPSIDNHIPFLDRVRDKSIFKDAAKLLPSENKDQHFKLSALMEIYKAAFILKTNPSQENLDKLKTLVSEAKIHLTQHKGLYPSNNLGSSFSKDYKSTLESCLSETNKIDLSAINQTKAKLTNSLQEEINPVRVLQNWNEAERAIKAENLSSRFNISR